MFVRLVGRRLRSVALGYARCVLSSQEFRAAVPLASPFSFDCFVVVVVVVVAVGGGGGGGRLAQRRTS